MAFTNGVKTIKLPESDKLKRLLVEKETIIDFIAWLHANGMKIGSMQGFEDLGCDVSLSPVRTSSEELSFRFLGIDSAKLENERCLMLRNLGASYD